MILKSFFHRGLVVAIIGFTMAFTSASAQDLPAKVGTGKAKVHQFAIIRSALPGQQPELLDIPDFVHTVETTSTANTWLDFSALYFHPPYMMQSPLTFQVREWLGAGPNHTVTAWYPYAHETTTTAMRVWNNVLVGVQADGLETSHPQWLTARGMESAATVKVYKPGPAGSKPDDVGTTEGDVFIFMRGPQPLDLIQPVFDAKANQWSFHSGNIFSDVVPDSNESTRWGWVAENSKGDEIDSRIVDLQTTSSNLERRTTASVAVGKYSTSTLDLRGQLNEAIAGNGLRSDEAEAQAELVLQSVAKAKGPVLIYFLTQEWVDARYPLKIEGPAEKPVRLWMVIKDLPR